MPGTTVQRSATLTASLPTVWELIADPHHQPRWWPGVARVEGVAERRFTQVLTTRRGRSVRVDYTVCELQAPHRVVWRQELAGSPFARVLAAASITLELRDDGARTVVQISSSQRLRGSSRTGGFMLRRATRRRLDEALARLRAIV